MNGGELFNQEIEVIDRAEAALAAGLLTGGPSADEYEWLLAKYKRLYKQSQHLIRLGDRMQRELGQVNEKLRSSEEKYRNLFENSAEGIFRILPDGAFVEANPAMADILGYDDPGELTAGSEPAGGACKAGLGDCAPFLAEVLATGHARRHQTVLRRGDGRKIWVEISARLVEGGGDGPPCIEGILADVTDRMRLHEELTHLATMDDLTGIFNRRCFLEKFDRAVDFAWLGRRPLTLLMIDVDHFKKINDRYGHDLGDKVLGHLTGVCRGVLREQDIFGRVGGEEFAVALPETDLPGARGVGERLRSAVQNSILRDDGREIRITVSVGISQLTAGAAGAEALLKNADAALYHAKRSGRNAVSVHSGRGFVCRGSLSVK